MLRSPLRLLWSLVLTVAGLPKWLLAAWIMLLALMSSDFHAEAAQHSQLLSGAAWSEPLADGSPVSEMASHRVASPSQPRQLDLLLGHAALVVAQASQSLRAEPAHRGRGSEMAAPYLLLHEWSMEWVLLLLCGLGLFLALLYPKQSFLAQFSRFTAALWNRKHLQYRFTHTAA